MEATARVDNGSFLTLICLSSPLVPVDVDVERPENNREFIIHDVGQQIPGVDEYAGSLLHGYWIVLPMDPRWAMDDPRTVFYSASLNKSGGSEVHVKVPSFDYDLRHNRDAFVVSQDTEDFDVQAIDDMIYTYTKSSVQLQESRKWRYYTLSFPSDHKLSSSAIYKKAGKEERLKDIYISVDMTHAMGKRFFVAWHVARTDLKGRAAGKVGEEEEEISLLAKQLQRMGYTNVKRTDKAPSHVGSGMQL